jgi:hypothetical protein
VEIVVFPEDFVFTPVEILIQGYSSGPKSFGVLQNLINVRIGKPQFGKVGLEDLFYFARVNVESVLEDIIVNDLGTEHVI